MGVAMNIAELGPLVAMVTVVNLIHAVVPLFLKKTPSRIHERTVALRMHAERHIVLIEEIQLARSVNTALVAVDGHSTEYGQLGIALRCFRFVDLQLPPHLNDWVPDCLVLTRKTRTREFVSQTKETGEDT